MAFSMCQLTPIKINCILHHPEGVKPSEVYRRMSAQYGSSCLNQRNVYKWIARFKEGRTSIKDELRQRRPSEMNTPEKQQSDDDYFLGHERPHNC